MTYNIVKKKNIREDKYIMYHIIQAILSCEYFKSDVSQWFDTASY